jgi:hypothetical protein
MSVDFAALTAAVGAGLPEVRACLIVSRDGLALGSFPPAEEAAAMDRWVRLVSLGDVNRGFAVVGEECWIFCSRGPYSILAVAKASARPGIILERLDQMVLAAEEARLRKDDLSPAGLNDPAAAARRRRTPPTGVHPGQSPQLPSPSDRPPARMTGGLGIPGQGIPPAGPVRIPEGRGGGQASAQPLVAAEQERRDQGPSTNPSVPAGRPAPATGRPEPAPTDAQADGPSEASGQDQEAAKASEQRSLWVMDVDDLTREFAGLLDPKDGEG